MTIETANDNDDAYAAKLEAAMPTMIEAAERLERAGYTLPEIGDAFLLVATRFGAGMVGTAATAKILSDLGRRLAVEKPPARCRAH